MLVRKLDWKSFEIIGNSDELLLLNNAVESRLASLKEALEEEEKAFGRSDIWERWNKELHDYMILQSKIEILLYVNVGVKIG